MDRSDMIDGVEYDDDGNPKPKKKPAVLPEGAALNPNGTVTYSLIHPLEYKKGEANCSIADVTVNRTKMADRMAIKNINNVFDIGFTMIQRLTGLSKPEMNLLDENDADNITECIAFLGEVGRGNGPKVGKEI